MKFLFTLALSLLISTPLMAQTDSNEDSAHEEVEKDENAAKKDKLLEILKNPKIDYVDRIKAMQDLEEIDPEAARKLKANQRRKIP